MRVLYTSSEVRIAIEQVLGAPKLGERRVVVVAFVGAMGARYLPDPGGIELVCWLLPGATDADALRRLRRDKVKLFRVARLHTKIYWSSLKGCVIGSANLSETALSGEKQLEAGVLLPPGAVDIDHLLRQIEPTRVTDLDLVRLKKATDLLPKAARRPDIDEASGSATQFIEWLHSGSSRSREWKLGWWNSHGDVIIGKSVRERLHDQYQREEPDLKQNFEKGQVKRGDWLLRFKLPQGTEPDWMFVDFAVEVDRSDKRAYIPEYPVQAVEVDVRNRAAVPPFELTREFKLALRRAVKAYGEDRFMARRSLHPPKLFLDHILDELRRIGEAST